MKSNHNQLWCSVDFQTFPPSSINVSNLNKIFLQLNYQSSKVSLVFFFNSFNFRLKQYRIKLSSVSILLKCLEWILNWNRFKWSFKISHLVLIKQFVFIYISLSCMVEVVEEVEPPPQTTSGWNIYIYEGPRSISRSTRAFLTWLVRWTLTALIQLPPARWKPPTHWEFAASILGVTRSGMARDFIC